MTWRVEWDDAARRELRKLDHSLQKRILAFTGERLAAHPNPRQMGKPLVGRFSGLWRYRVGDCRLICSLEDEHLTILVVRVGNRKDIYQ